MLPTDADIILDGKRPVIINNRNCLNMYSHDRSIWSVVVVLRFVSGY